MNFIPRPIRVLTLVAGIALIGATAATPASASVDTTPPTISTDPHPHYVVDSQLGTSYDGSDLMDWQASYSLDWKASDASGICAQTLTEQSYDMMGGEEDPLLGWQTGTYTLSNTERSHKYFVDAFDQNRVPYRFVLRVTDCAGNVATSPIITSYFDIKEDSATGITYQGTWAASSCSCFSGGTTHYTKAVNSSASVRVQGSHPIALVMEKAPNRGAAAVYVDGVLKATINTYSATTRHSVIVWQTELAGTALHTLKVVNKATAGHPRMDIDAILL